MDQCQYSHLAHANDLDPADGHKFLREHCPVHHETGHDPDFYVVSRYTDVMDVLKTPDLWRNGDGPGVFVQRGGVLGSTDNPDHIRHRRVLQPAFMPRQIAALETHVREICSTMLDEVLPLGAGDIVDLFAFPFPALVVAELFGVPEGDRDTFKNWSSAVTNALGGGDMNAYEEATKGLWAYIDTQVDSRGAVLDASGWKPGDGDPLGTLIPDDVMSRLLMGERDGDLTRREVERLGHQLLVAGHETTAGLIGTMLRRLCLQPELADALRADPSLMELAVEEAVRYESPAQGLFRTNAEDTVVGGVEIAAGTKMQVLFASANRDPERWDDPDTFRLDRDPEDLRKHIGFGFGVHFCIGAPIARVATKVAVGEFLRRTSSFEMTGDAVGTPPFILRGLSQLPLRWTQVA